jgi:hypothetical protein
MPRAAGPVPQWPATLPDPQGEGFTVLSPVRAVPTPTLYGPTRLTIRARTAPMQWTFAVIFTPEQLEVFEGWYRDAVENHDGEFYARWVGAGRVVAFSAPYAFTPIGKGWALHGSVIRTRIDDTICDGHLETIFGAIYQAHLAAVDLYEADLGAVDIYEDAFDLQLIADNEC